MTVESAKAKLIQLLLQLRANRRLIYASFSVVVISLTGLLVDAFWMPWTSAGSRMVPFMGLVVVCGVGMWMVKRIAGENARLHVRIATLVESLEGQLEHTPTEKEEAALEQQFKLNQKLAYALVVAGVVGGVSLAATMIVSLGMVLDSPWTGLAVLGVSCICIGVSLVWTWQGRKLAKVLRDRGGEDEVREE